MRALDSESRGERGLGGILVKRLIPFLVAMAAIVVLAIPAFADALPLKTASDPKLGTILVDGNGMTLYLYTKDTPNTSNCYNACATAWPPLFADSPAAVSGLPGTLSTTTRTDGKKQVTYNGWPLYYYVKDTKVGDVTGQNVGQVWFVINPSAGPTVPPTPAAATTAAPAAPAAPAPAATTSTLPRTGGFPINPAELAGAAAILGGLGFVLRRRRVG